MFAYTKPSSGRVYAAQRCRLPCRSCSVALLPGLAARCFGQASYVTCVVCPPSGVLMSSDKHLSQLCKQSAPSEGLHQSLLSNCVDVLLLQCCIGPVLFAAAVLIPAFCQGLLQTMPEGCLSCSACYVLSCLYRLCCQGICTHLGSHHFHLVGRPTAWHAVLLISIVCCLCWARPSFSTRPPVLAPQMD